MQDGRLDRGRRGRVGRPRRADPLPPERQGLAASAGGPVRSRRSLPQKREAFKDLAILIWRSYGTMTVLLQEILAVYHAVDSSTALAASAASRACHTLALLQIVASHPETRIPFVRAKIPEYFYPFLKCTKEGKSFESLRITSLGILGALVKADDVEIIRFLLKSEVIPLCLRIMEMGSELSKIVATFIIEKILMNHAGLTFVCDTVDRFFDLSNVLATMVAALVKKPCTKILKHVICCYLNLTYNPRGLVALRISLPEALKDGTFDNCLREDAEAVQWLQQLLDRLRGGGAEGTSLPGPRPAGGGSAGRGAPPPVLPGDAAGGSSSGASMGNNIWKWVDLIISDC